MYSPVTPSKMYAIPLMLLLSWANETMNGPREYANDYSSLVPSVIMNS